MNRIARIRERRSELIVEIARSRDGLSASASRVRGWFAPVALGITAGRLLSARRWMRFAALGMLAAAAIRKWRQ